MTYSVSQSCIIHNQKSNSNVGHGYIELPQRHTHTHTHTTNTVTQRQGLRACYHIVPTNVDKILDSGHVGTLISWVRVHLKDPVCNIFYIVVYIPHKGRVTTPTTEDTIVQLTQLLQTQAVKNQNV